MSDTQSGDVAAALAELNSENYRSLVSMFERICADNGDRKAYACLGVETTYAEMDEKTGQFAAFLRNTLGLEPGDRIALQMPNITQYPIAAWGALRAGLVLVNTNPLYTEKELIHQFNDSGARALVVVSEMLPRVEPVIGDTGIEHVIVTSVFDLFGEQDMPATELPSVHRMYSGMAEAADTGVPESTAEMSDIAVLQYTGGTTGVSKGAVLTHGNLLSGARMSGIMWEEEFGHPENEIVIAPMPLYHVYGFTMNIIGVPSRGGLSVLIADPRNMDDMIKTMKSYPFTNLAGVNTLFVAMLNHPDFDSIDWSHFTGAIAGGAALVEEVGDEWEKRTGTQIYEGYGLSETSAVVSCNSKSFRRLGTVGRAMKYAQCRIVNDAGEDVAFGDEGELWVKGPQVMKGYYNRPDETAKAMTEDGWFKTGDIVVQQDQGFMKIVDRLKDMILVSGFNVFPNEVEAAAYGHPGVLECAAIGIPDSKTGEAVKLFVVKKDDSLDEESLRSFCRESLTNYKVPKFIEFRDELPKSNVGKILRRELRPK